jgi:hypothetical protein
MNKCLVRWLLSGWYAELFVYEPSILLSNTGFLNVLSFQTFRRARWNMRIKMLSQKTIGPNLNCLINSAWTGFPLRHMETRKEHEVSHRRTASLSFASGPLLDKKRPASVLRGIRNSATDRFIIHQMMTHEWAACLVLVVTFIVRYFVYNRNQNALSKNFKLNSGFI